MSIFDYFLSKKIKQIRSLENKLKRTEKELEELGVLPKYIAEKWDKLFEEQFKSNNNFENNSNEDSLKEKIIVDEVNIKNDLIEKWGTILAKYKYPKEFGIYNLSNKELGDRYERYIGYLYEIQNYRVDFQGLTKKKKDRGIDIVAKKKKEIIIIQCKRYGKNTIVHENTIHQLNSVVQFYKSKNEGKDVKGILYTVNNNLDDEAKEVLTCFNLQHIVCPYPLEEAYPLIKCNINNSNGEKIYHLPGFGQYDRIKIEPKKGEFYVQTIQEAEGLGFRSIN